MAYQEEPKKRGCLFYGCFTSVILLMLVIAAAGYGIWKARQYALDFTDTKPLEFAALDVDQDTLSAISKKIETFKNTVAQGQDAATLTLTDQEVNALLASSPNGKELARMVRVTFQDNRAVGMISLPLEKMLSSEKMTMVKGRYLNGSATLKISAQDGTLSLVIESLEVRGKSLPDMIMKELRQTNLAEKIRIDPEQQNFWRQIQGIEIRDGQIVITAKSGKDAKILTLKDADLV